jgi:hypothetical protein
MAVFFWLGSPIVALLAIILFLYLLERAFRLIHSFRSGYQLNTILFYLTLLNVVEPLVNIPLVAWLVRSRDAWTQYPHDPFSFAVSVSWPTLILLSPLVFLLVPQISYRPLLWSLLWRGTLRVVIVFGIFFLMGSRNEFWDLGLFAIGYIFLFHSIHCVSTAILE